MVSLSNPTLEDRAWIVYNRLKSHAYGVERAANAEQIHIVAYGQAATLPKTNRVIRQRAYNIIKYIRDNWDIVCEINLGSAVTGYFIPATVAEVEEYLARTGAGIGTRLKSWNGQKAMAKKRFPELDIQEELGL